MKILVLTCGTGEGHNSAAMAVHYAALRAGLDSTVKSILDFTKSPFNSVFQKCYNGIIKKAPYVFSAAYKAGEFYSSTKLVSPVYMANKGARGKIHEYVTENGFDAVICSHLFAMESLTALKRKYNPSYRCYGVFTDYTCVPFSVDTSLDAYFLPSELLADEYVSKGFIREDLYGSGIPVDEKFNNHIPKDEARKMLGFPEGKRVILVMSGGIGSGKLLELSEEIAMQTGECYVAYVLVGKNDELKNKLAEKYGEDGKIRAVGFTKQVNVFMNASDVLITKPGGLTSTETAVAGIPMIGLLSYAANEEKNIAFFEKTGMAVRASDARDAVAKAALICENKQIQKDMVAAQYRTINPNAADDIVKTVVDTFKCGVGIQKGKEASAE